MTSGFANFIFFTLFLLGRSMPVFSLSILLVIHIDELNFSFSSDENRDICLLEANPNGILIIFFNGKGDFVLKIMIAYVEGIDGLICQGAY